MEFFVDISLSVIHIYKGVKSLGTAYLMIAFRIDIWKQILVSYSHSTVDIGK